MRRSFFRLRVTNPDGLWLDLGALTVNGTAPKNFVNTATISKNIDENTLSMSATVRRETDSLSLVPLRTDSPLNARSDFTYAPTLDIRRLWAIDVAVLPGAGVPGFRPLAAGVITTLDISGDPPESKTPGTITLAGRGMEMALLKLEQLFEQDYVGATIATRLQAMADRWNAGVTVVPDASAPSFFVNAGTQPVGPLMPALQEIAQLPGAVLRYMYDSADVNRFTLFTPNRSPSGADWVFGPSEYRSIPVARLDLDTIRNYIPLTYVDAAFGEQTITSPAPEPTTVSAAAGAATFSASPGGTLADGAVIVVDGVAYTVSAYDAGAGTATLSGAPTFTGKQWVTSASITRYGLLPFPIGLARTTNVTNLTDAGAMADAIRSDLEFPAVEWQIESEGAWFVELYDYLELAPNRTHNSDSQFMGVTSVTYTFAGGKLMVLIGGRGKPAGGYRSWLALGGAGSRAPFVPVVTSLSAEFVEQTVGLIRVAFVTWTATVNQYAKSVMAELSATDDFAVVLNTEYADVTAGVASGLFTGVARDQIYYVRVTPYSGPLDAGLPTGVAGVPVVDSTFVQFEVPDKPSFDVLDGTVATIGTDVATLQAEPITVWDTPSSLTNFRKWVDSAEATIDLATPNEIAVRVPGLAAAIGAVTSVAGVVQRIPIFDVHSGVPVSWGSIPSALGEISTALRRRCYLAGATAARIVATITSAALAGTKVAWAYTTDLTGATGWTDVAEQLSLASTGPQASAWSALPALTDILITPKLVGGDGATTAKLTSLVIETSVTGYTTTVPTGMNDPFTGAAGPVDPKWSKWAATINLPTVALDGAGKVNVDPQITGGWDPAGIDQPMPAGDWEFEISASMVHRDWENGVGMVIREAATNKLMAVAAFNRLSGAAYQLNVDSISGYLYSSTIALVGGSFVGLWRIGRVGSTYYFRYNYNGAGWVTAWSGTVGSYFTTAPDRIGLYVRPTVPNGAHAVGVFDYFTQIA